MKNLEVAQAFVTNAIAYGRSGDLSTVMVNLELIQELLENPDEENQEYDSEDFK